MALLLILRKLLFVLIVALQGIFFSGIETVVVFYIACRLKHTKFCRKDTKYTKSLNLGVLLAGFCVFTVCKNMTTTQGDGHGIVRGLAPHPHLPLLLSCGVDTHLKIWAPGPENFGIKV